MAERIITIEIGAKITKVCETDYKGSPAVYQYFSFETPEGMIENQVVYENEEFKTTLEEMLKRHNIKTRKVVFVISTIGIGTKEEVIPNMKEQKMRDYIKTNLGNFFPVDPKECHVAFRVNGTTKEGKNRVQLFAVNNNIVYGYETLALFCKLNMLDIEFAENGVALSLRDTFPAGNVVNVDVEDTFSAITIIKDGQIALQRSIAYGVDEAVRSLQENNFFGEGLTYNETLERMAQTESFFDSFSDIYEKQQTEPARAEATEGLRYVISNVRRILEYYQSQNQGIAFDRLILSGLGASCKGFAELMEAETGFSFGAVPVEVVNKTAKNLDEGIRSIAFSAIVAAATSKGLVQKKQGLDLEKLLREPGDNSTARKLFAICVLVSAVLIVIPVVKRVVLQGKQASLESEIATMQEAKKVNDEYQKTKSIYDELIEMNDMTQTSNDGLLPLLQEMEGALPTDAVITEMSASQEAVSIYFTAPSKSVAAKTIQAFRGFSSVERVSVDALTEDMDDTGAGSYTFILTCYYPGTGLEDAGDGTESATAESSSDASQTEGTQETTGSTESSNGEVAQ